MSRLTVRTEGDGIPVLIIHGWMMAGSVESFDFEPIFKEVEGYQRHYIDLPGMGLSSGDGVVDLDTMVARVEAYIASKVLPTSFLLVGTSCGGYLARALAYKYSTVVLGLLLRVPVVEPWSPKRDLEQVSPVVSDITIDQVDIRLRKFFKYMPFQTADYVAALVEKWNCFETAMAAADEKMLNLIRGDSGKYVLSKSMHNPEEPFLSPTLIVLGRHDADVGYRDASSKGILESYPRATIIMMDAGTHALPVTKSEIRLFKASTIDWLDRVSEYEKLRAK